MSSRFIKTILTYFVLLTTSLILKNIVSSIAIGIVGRTIGIDEIGESLIITTITHGFMIGYAFQAFFYRPSRKTQKDQETARQARLLGLPKKKLALGVCLGLSLATIIITIMIVNGTVNCAVIGIINLTLSLIGIIIGLVTAKLIFLLVIDKIRAELLGEKPETIEEK